MWNERRVEISASELVRSAAQTRQIALDARDLFLGFLDEHLDELGIRPALLDLHHARRRRSGLRLRGRRERRGLRPRRHGCHRRLRHRQRFQQIEAAIGVVEHVPRIGTARADRLEVVLDADDRVGEPLEVLGLELRADGEPRADHGSDSLDDRHGLRLVEHQEPGRDPAQLRLGLLERPRIGGILDELNDGFLHLREVHRALAHDGLRDFPLLRVRGAGGLRRLGLIAGHDGPHELAIERVLDVEQGRGYFLEDVPLGRPAVRDDRGELLRLALDLAARFVEPKHAERVADLFQHVELRAQPVGAVHARAHEDVERVLDACRDPL